MELKVDYERVDSIGSSVEKEVENLYTKKDELLKIIEDFGSCWEGDDYDEFKENAGVYIRNMKIKIDELEYVAGFMRYASSRYSNNDDAWANKLKEIKKEEDWKIQENG